MSTVNTETAVTATVTETPEVSTTETKTSPETAKVEADSKVDSFKNQMNERIKKARDNAEIVDENKIIILKPEYTDDITEESVRKHVNFINEASVISEKVVSDIAYEKGDAGKWRGLMDLGSVEINTFKYPKEEFQLEGDEVETQYGNSDTIIDYKMSKELTEFQSHFREIDEIRFKELFGNKPTVIEEDVVVK